MNVKPHGRSGRNSGRGFSTLTFNVGLLLSSGHLFGSSFLRAEDIGFFCAQYRTATEGKRRAGWRQLLFTVFNPADPSALDELSDLAITDSGIAQTLAAYTSMPLLPEAQNWPKRHLEQEREEQRRKAASWSGT